MTDNSKRISRLVLKKLHGSLSHAEQEVLEEWLSKDEECRIWFEEITNNKFSLTRRMLAQAAAEGKSKPDWDHFTKKYFPDKTVKPARVISIGRGWMVAAAILLLILSGGYYGYLKYRPTSATHTQLASNNDVAAPQGNNTVLTLGDGSRIVLDSMHIGKLATQGKTNIDKTAKGQIVYTPVSARPAAEVLMNTLSTSYGGSSKLVLPDGSIVWLNALSSVRFPNAFVGKSREVELTGEGYFEIAPDKNHPFYVKVNGTEIEVMGTHFDVMAYTNEQRQTITLLEGAVKVREAQQTVVLAPGQQAMVGAGVQVVDKEDPDQVIAWVGGKFKFRSEGIESIMRQLERWYNIEVTFDGRPAIQLSGSISKTKNLSAVLELLRLSGVNCTIEGRKVIVRP